VRAYDNRPTFSSPNGQKAERPRPDKSERQKSHVSNARHGAPEFVARPKKADQEISSFTLKGPGAVIARRAADRLRGGHVWVYASDVEQVQAGELPLLTVVDNRGIPLGTALYSSASQIALRMVSTELLTNHEQWLALLTERLHAAFSLRASLMKTDEDTNAARLVFSEGDALPGLIIDKYADLIIMQLLTQGLDRQDTRETIVKALREQFDPATIVERPDPRIREIEQLPAPSLEPLYARDTSQPLLHTQFRMNGLSFHYDAGAGQKTGAFLDQSRNYAAAEHYAHGDALDVCTYQGGFALHMARKCTRVTGVDVSRAALEVAERNLEANRSRIAGEVDWIEANAFDLMRDWSDTGMQFDTIVLDPPAFAKTKRAAENAVRGYKELMLRALKMLRPGGILVTCSCSHHVSLAEFTQVVATAAVDAGRRVQLLERRGAAPDHPHILSAPETEYLKCLICEVS
jgi:23S rRNA (cytosine1962-C5)-methyltransferase